MELKFYHVGGACFIIDVDGILKISCDPCLNPVGTEYDFKFFKSTRIKEPVYDESLFSNIDVWLLTHKHADHIDSTGISKINKSSVIIAEKKVVSLLPEDLLKNVHLLAWHQEKHLAVKGYQIKIKAIPAYHGNNYIARNLAGKVNGYLVTIISRENVIKQLYITSDTVYHPKVISSLKEEKIDLMVANLGQVLSGKFGGPLTMSVDMLRQFVFDINPATVIPIHIDDFSHYQTSAEKLTEAHFSIIEQGNWILF